MKTPKALDEKKSEAATLKDIQSWDLMQPWDARGNFESAVYDLEESLKMNADVWLTYLSNPRPFLTDLLDDFGSFCQWKVQGHEWEVAVAAALDNYLGVVKTI